MSPGLRRLFLLVDVGFIVYWLITLLHVVPDAYLFKDYASPLATAWNGSFLPLDLAISATGIAAMLLARRARPAWRPLALVSLALTFCSGLQAISYWTLRCDVEPAWWAPNLFLLLYPLLFLPALVRDQAVARAGARVPTP